MIWLRYLEFSILFVIALAFASNSARAADDTYSPSPLSSESYRVLRIASNGAFSGCAAISLQIKPQLFVMITTKGDGTIAVIAKTFKLSTTSQVSRLTLNIGTTKHDKVYVVDGNTATFDLSKPEFRNSDKSKMTINGVEITGENYSALITILNKCLDLK
jgi:hypothetical protein